MVEKIAALVIALILVWLFGSVAQAQPVDVQEKCASQAQKTFQEDEIYYKSQPSETVSSDYQSHYNARLNQCLMLVHRITSFESQLSTSWYLLDANERREYAYYLETGSKVLMCELVANIQEKKFCDSRGQFDAFVAGYMEK